MKKQLSLFMSITLILIMIFSMSAQAASVQIKPVNVLIDTTDATTVTHVAGETAQRRLQLDGVTNYSLQIRNRSITNILSTFAGYTNVLEYGRTTGAQFITFYTANTSGTKPVLSEGTYVINAKFRTNSALATRDWYLNYGDGQLKTTLYTDSSTVKILPDIWYDMEYKIDLDKSADNVSIVYTPELTGVSSAEIPAYTISKTASYTDPLKDLRAYIYTDVGTAADTSTPRTYWANIKVTHTLSPYNKASIISVGSDGEVAFDQNEVSFKLSEKIPGLSVEHISIKNAGGQDVAISSAAITSDGTYPVVNLTTSNPLPAWTQYTLTISGDAWGKASIQSDASTQGEVTAISADFHTPAAPFDMRDPVFGLSGGKLTVDTTLINTSGTPQDVTLAIVIYGADGRIKSVNPTSYEDFEAAYPGADKHIEAPISEGESAKIIAINGWTNKTALFGKYWETNYAELNQ